MADDDRLTNSQYVWNQLNYKHDALIEASAGTGKTYALESIVLKLVQEEGYDATSILLVTFTEKAAGELKNRIRKALDEAGFKDVTIITTGVDYKGMHPGFQLGLDFRLHMLWGLVTMDAIEIMYRAVRPYEVHEGDTQKIYDEWMPKVISVAGNLTTAQLVRPSKLLEVFDQCIEAFNSIEITEDRKKGIRKPRVAVLGEILMNYHPSANGFIENYLMNNGMEVYLPGMTDFFRVDEVVRAEKVKRGFSAIASSQFSGMCQSTQ